MNIILYSAATSLILTSSKSSLIKSSKLRYLGNVILLKEVNEKQIFQCMLEKSHDIVTLNQTSSAHVKYKPVIQFDSMKCCIVKCKAL